MFRMMMRLPFMLALWMGGWLLCSTPGWGQVPDRTQPPPVGPAPRLALPPVHQVTLENGLGLWLFEKHQVPLVQVVLQVRAGRVDEAPGQYGLAGLVADMLDEGAGERSALELADAFELLGARFSIAAGDHTTSLSLRVPAARLAPALALMADVVMHPTFPAEELERLRVERLTELLRRYDEPNEIAGAQLFQALYGGPEHPYARPALGTEADLRRFTVDDLRAFYEAYYRPGQATLIVAGDVSGDDLAVFEEAFGGWARGAGASPPVLPETPQVQGRTVYLIDKPGAAQSVIRIGRLGAARSTPDYYALEVLNTVLGGSFTSRLNQNLREDKGYTYGARSWFDYRPVPGPFVAGAAVQTDVTGPALAEFMKELRKIREPIPAEEVTRARNFLAMRFPAGFQTVAGIAGRLAELVRYNLSPDTFNAYTDRILAVTEADVARVAQAYIDPDNLVIVVVGDRARIEEQVRGLNLGPVVVRTVAEVLGSPPDLSGR